MADKRQKKRTGLGRFLFGLTARTIMLLNAGVLVLSYLSLVVNPAKAWFITIFGLLFLPFFLINLFLLVWAVIRRSRAFVIPLLALLPAFFLVGRYVQFGAPESVPAGEGTVKVVSYNVGKFEMAPERAGLTPEECADSVFAFLRLTDADIICLQEMKTARGVDVREYLGGRMPEYNVEYFAHTSRHGSYSAVILSRFPVLRKGKFDFEESSNLALYADLDTGDGVVRVYNCHFQSYAVSVSGLAEGIAHKDSVFVQQAEEKMRSSIIRRPQQVGQVLDDIRESPVKSIVTGDFNDTPMSYTYSRLKRGNHDSFVEAGRGLGGTYSVLWPFIRIDYVLYPSAFKAVSHKVVRKKLSDHYPIVTELKIN